MVHERNGERGGSLLDDRQEGWLKPSAMDVIKTVQTHSLTVRRTILHFSVNDIHSAGSQTLCDRPIPRPEEYSRVRVCACH